MSEVFKSLDEEGYRQIFGVWSGVTILILSESTDKTVITLQVKNLILLNSLRIIIIADPNLTFCIKHGVLFVGDRDLFEPWPDNLPEDEAKRYIRKAKLQLITLV